jgi:hypothetical protein
MGACFGAVLAGFIGYKGGGDILKKWTRNKKSNSIKEDKRGVEFYDHSNAKI